MSETINADWKTEIGLTDREWSQVVVSRYYAANHSDAGLVGHTAMLLIAKLANHLDRVCSFTPEETKLDRDGHN